MFESRTIRQSSAPRRRGGLTTCLALCLVLSAASRWPAAAEPAAADGKTAIRVPVGEIVPKIATAYDPAQQYSLYLPPGYDTGRRWPVLIVLDPRGRAVRAMRLFRRGAEANGWVVLSSHQSRSDTSAKITVDAFRALLRELDRYAVDPRRLYLAGMSGTAFASWHFAVALPDPVAGVIACGAGLPRDLSSPGDEVPFAYFGLAGNTDFNYLEQRELDDQLAEVEGAAHRFEVFEGRHGWPPDDRWTTVAIDWMELVALRRGLVRRDAAWVKGQLAAARDSVADAVAAEQPLLELRRLEQLVRDFDGLADVSAERRRAAELRQSKEVRRARSHEEKVLDKERTYAHRIRRWKARFEDPRRSPTKHGRSLFELRVQHLQEQAADDSDPVAAAAALRQLATAYVQTVFYLPNTYLENGDLERAAAVLELASAIFPARPHSHLRRAEIYARRKEPDRAFEALREAVSLGGVDVARLRSDPAWDSLHQDPGWTALLADLESPEPGGDG